MCIYIQYIYYKHKYVIMLMISVNTKTISALVCPTVSQKHKPRVQSIIIGVIGSILSEKGLFNP